jgi:hypothetical protein
MHDIMAEFKECFVNDSSPSDTVVLGLKYDMWQIENAMKEFFVEKLDPFWCSSTVLAINKNRSVRRSLKYGTMNQQLKNDIQLRI